MSLIELLYKSLGDIKTTPSVEAAVAGFDIHPSFVRRGAFNATHCMLIAAYNAYSVI